MSPTAERMMLAVAGDNPFRGMAKLHLRLPVRAHVCADVFDVSGRRVRTRLDVDREAREHSLEWDGHDAAGSRLHPGVFPVRVRAGEFVATRRLVTVHGAPALDSETSRAAGFRAGRAVSFG